MKKTNGDTAIAKAKTGGDKSKDDGKGWTYDAEPALLVHIATSLMVILVVQNLLMEKTCLVNLGYSEEVCDALVSKNADAEKYIEEEKEIQKLVGSVMVWRTVLENIFPLFLVLLIGAWSDKYGRKLPMLFVIVGYFVQNFLLMLCVYFKYTVGAWTVAIVASVIPGLTGNQASFGMAVFSYVSDKTSPDKRTVRNGITHIVFFLGLTIGLGAGGVVSQLNISAAKIFIFGAIVEIFVFIYVVLVIKTVRDEKAVKGKTTSDMIVDLFNTKHARDTFTSVFKKRPGNTRMTLWILLISHLCIMAPMMGEMGVIYLFGRYKFNWDGGDIGYFMTYRTVLGFFGNFLSMGLLGKALKMSDPAIGVACCFSGLLGNVLFVFANSNFMMYLGPLVQILSSAAIIVPRSIVSKIIPGNEMGKVGSFFACLDSINPLIGAPIYTFVYTSTFETFPGAFFLLSGALSIPPILAFAWVQISEEKKLKKK